MKNPFMLRKTHDRLMTEQSMYFGRQRQATKELYEERAYELRAKFHNALDMLEAARNES